MFRYLFVFSFIIILVSCNEEQSFDPLREPPYDKITDSIKKQPANAELYYRRGILLYGNDQPVFAARDIRKAWDLSPKEEYALSLVTLYRQKHTDTAIAFVQEALKKLPNSIALQIGLARGYEQKQQVEAALKVCNDIISKYPGQLDALVLKSELLKRQDKTTEAIQVLETAYGYAPGDVELAHTLAFDYADAKNPKALSLSDSLIEADISQRQPEPYYFKGLYHENNGNYSQAINFFNEAISRDYYFIDAYHDKGQCYYEQKKYKEAVKTYRLAITVSPTNAISYYWLAKTEEAMGDKQEAKLDYQRAYGLDKNMKEAKEAADRL
jgi:tetratricopeptide (TPR) repeat protein